MSAGPQEIVGRGPELRRIDESLDAIQAELAGRLSAERSQARREDDADPAERPVPG